MATLDHDLPGWDAPQPMPSLFLWRRSALSFCDRVEISCDRDSWHWHRTHEPRFDKKLDYLQGHSSLRTESKQEKNYSVWACMEQMDSPQADAVGKCEESVCHTECQSVEAADVWIPGRLRGIAFEVCGKVLQWVHIQGKDMASNVCTALV
jgi:hypothetical protein